MKRTFCFLFVILLTISAGFVFSVKAAEAHSLSSSHYHDGDNVIYCNTDWWNPCPAEALPAVTAAEQQQIVQAVQLDAVIFNEIFNGSMDTHDWVELRNITDADVDLSDWKLIFTTSETRLSFSFPAGTTLAVGEVLLFLNTDPSAADMPLASSEEVSYHYLVDEDFILPQGEFTLLLRSTDSWKDAIGNYFFDYEQPPTVPLLTEDIAWSREKVSVLGTRSEAWVESGYQDGLGYDDGSSEDISPGTPGYRRPMIADVNGDDVVNILDLVFVASHFGASDVAGADLNSDGIVNIQDLVLVANGIGGAAAAPSVRALSALQVEQWLRLAKEGATLPIQTWISQSDFSYERGIQVLEQLHRMLLPKETALLANYPNPFNPETWIPYQLATDSDVQITIYDAHGILVRQFDLGHRAAGLYQSRSRASYWDGTNALGESVASGIYFYTLTAEDFSATRKMLILK